MAGMEPHPDTAALGPMLVTSAAIVLLGLRKQLLVWRRSVCPACGVERRSCGCRRGAA
jgi:hypothetical protein